MRLAQRMPSGAGGLSTDDGYRRRTASDAQVVASRVLGKAKPFSCPNRASSPVGVKVAARLEVMAVGGGRAGICVAAAPQTYKPF